MCSQARLSFGLLRPPPHIRVRQKSLVRRCAGAVWASSGKNPPNSNTSHRGPSRPEFSAVFCWMSDGQSKSEFLVGEQWYARMSMTPSLCSLQSKFVKKARVDLVVPHRCYIANCHHNLERTPAVLAQPLVPIASPQHPLFWGPCSPQQWSCLTMTKVQNVADCIDCMTQPKLQSTDDWRENE